MPKGIGPGDYILDESGRDITPRAKRRLSDYLSTVQEMQETPYHSPRWFVLKRRAYSCRHELRTRAELDGVPCPDIPTVPWKAPING